jgi:hypothetical protein
MKKVFIFIPMILLIVSHSFAQKKSKDNGAAFYSLLQAGVTNGSKASSLTIEGKLGLSFSNTFVGIGAGVDYYRFRTVPLFIDLRQEFGRGPNLFFIYGDIGKNIKWVTEENKMLLTYIPGDFKSGKYYEAGFGYRVRLQNSGSLLFSGGYSVKSVKKVNDANFCPVVGTCFYFSDKYLYNMSRIVFRLGWQF